MPVGCLHCREYTLDELVRDLLVKQIAHRVHEDDSRLTQLQRQTQPAGPEHQVESVFVRMSRHAPEAFNEVVGIAVVAPWRYLRTSRDRVPRCLRPLNR